MQELSRLQKKWNDTARFRAVRSSLRLERDGVVLGAGTVITTREGKGGLCLERGRERMLALLSIASGRPVSSTVLRAFARASGHARRGDDCLASMTLALAEVPAVTTGCAKRLFIADGLMAAGVEASQIWEAAEFELAALSALSKFDPGEARNPKGDGHASGEWTDGSGVIPAIGSAASAGRAAEAIASAVGNAAPKVLSRLAELALDAAELAEDLNLPLAVLNELLQTTPLNGAHLSGPVRGHPAWIYSGQQDEPGLLVTDKRSGKVVLPLVATAIPGQFADPKKTVIAHLEDHELVIRNVTEAAQTAERKKPQMCPEPPLPDYPGMIGPRGDRSRGYADFMRLQINPEDPTPPGMAYFLINPTTGRRVSYDDCEKRSGSLQEFKGLGYASQVGPMSSPAQRARIAAKWYGQATRQVLGSGGLRLQWKFAEQPAMEFARRLFNGDPRLARIETQHWPWSEGENWKWKRDQWIRFLRHMAMLKRLECSLRNGPVEHF